MTQCATPSLQKLTTRDNSLIRPAYHYK